jgi:hypothetical protein
VQSTNCQGWIYSIVFITPGVPGVVADPLSPVFINFLSCSMIHSQKQRAIEDVFIDIANCSAGPSERKNFYYFLVKKKEVKNHVTWQIHASHHIWGRSPAPLQSTIRVFGCKVYKCRTYFSVVPVPYLIQLHLNNHLINLI